jgi:hypothetical protein
MKNHSIFCDLVEYCSGRYQMYAINPHQMKVSDKNLVEWMALLQLFLQLQLPSHL